jgi:hypothetical protein
MPPVQYFTKKANRDTPTPDPSDNPIDIKLHLMYGARVEDYQISQFRNHLMSFLTPGEKCSACPLSNASGNLVATWLEIVSNAHGRDASWSNHGRCYQCLTLLSPLRPVRSACGITSIVVRDFHVLTGGPLDHRLTA